MSYSDCSIYEGEWCDGKRCGQGMLRLRKSHMHAVFVAFDRSSEVKGKGSLICITLYYELLISKALRYGMC